MRRYALLLWVLFLAAVCQAQEVRPQLKSTIDTIDVNAMAPAAETHERLRPAERDFRQAPSERRDSLRLPLLNRFGQTRPVGFYPLWWGGWYDWQLHPGLNVNLGASVFAQLGKNAWYHGAGFQQNISMMYATPLSDKLSLAVGGYLNNVSWAHDSWRDAGFNAVLNYRFDDHWEAFVYGQKSLTSNRFLPLPLYDMGSLSIPASTSRSPWKPTNGRLGTPTSRLRTRTGTTTWTANDHRPILISTDATPLASVFFGNNIGNDLWHSPASPAYYCKKTMGHAQTRHAFYHF